MTIRKSRTEIDIKHHETITEIVTEHEKSMLNLENQNLALEGSPSPSAPGKIAANNKKILSLKKRHLKQIDDLETQYRKDIKDSDDPTPPTVGGVYTP